MALMFKGFDEKYSRHGNIKRPIYEVDGEAHHFKSVEASVYVSGLSAAAFVWCQDEQKVIYPLAIAQFSLQALENCLIDCLMRWERDYGLTKVVCNAIPEIPESEKQHAHPIVREISQSTGLWPSIKPFSPFSGVLALQKLIQAGKFEPKYWNGYAKLKEKALQMDEREPDVEVMAFLFGAANAPIQDVAFCFDAMFSPW
jgi:hypothetical protein